MINLLISYIFNFLR